MFLGIGNNLGRGGIGFVKAQSSGGAAKVVRWLGLLVRKAFTQSPFTQTPFVKG